jgi:excinuclease UvrABC helicase subunit UvrB
MPEGTSSHARYIDGRTLDLANQEIHDLRATAGLTKSWIDAWFDGRQYVHDKFMTPEDLLKAIANRIEKDYEYRAKNFERIMGYKGHL